MTEESYDDPNDDNYDDPNEPPETRTLNDRRKVHETFEVFERNSGDKRATYTILNGKQIHSLGLCRHTDVQQIVGEWMWAQMILKNSDVMRMPIHVFRNATLRYVYTAKSIDKSHEYTLVVCEKVTIPAGMIQEALLEETPIGFRFGNKDDRDREEGL